MRQRLDQTVADYRARTVEGAAAPGGAGGPGAEDAGAGGADHFPMGGDDLDSDDGLGEGGAGGGEGVVVGGSAAGDGPGLEGSGAGEEEERRFRQGLLQLDVEVRDLSSAIDTKEKLLRELARMIPTMESRRLRNEEINKHRAKIADQMAERAKHHTAKVSKKGKGAAAKK